MITALPVPSVKVFHKTYYHEKARTGASQPGSPLTDSEAIVALTEKEQPEYFFCGKVKYYNVFLKNINALHVVVGSILLGVVVLIVGLVQLAPGAEAAQYSTALIGVGCTLLALGALLAQLRALWLRRKRAAQKDSTHQRSVTSIDMLLAQHRDFTVLTPDELEDLVGKPTPVLENKVRKHGNNT
ncbi:GSCOCG00000708001-RA-CDS [Cotesia congregata]|nr:GSCOCG00000708001-RA-CDS [Cotesia congregata]